MKTRKGGLTSSSRTFGAALLLTVCSSLPTAGENVFVVPTPGPFPPNRKICPPIFINVPGQPGNYALVYPIRSDNPGDACPDPIAVFGSDYFTGQRHAMVPKLADVPTTNAMTQLRKELFGEVKNKFGAQADLIDALTKRIEQLEKRP